MDGFTDAVPLMLEDIAGYDVVDDKETQPILNQVGEINDGLINEGN